MDAIKFQEVRDQFIIPSRLFTVPAHGLPAEFAGRCADELLRSLGSTQLQLPANLRGRANAHKLPLGAQVCHPSPQTQTQTRQGKFSFILTDCFFSSSYFFVQSPVLISCKTEIPHQRQSRDLHKVYWGVCKRKCCLQGSAWRCEPDAMFRRWRQHELFTAAAADRRRARPPFLWLCCREQLFFGAGNVSFTTRLQHKVLAPQWHSATCWSGTGRSSHPVSAALMVVSERWCSLSFVGGSVNIKMCSLAIYKEGKKNHLQ